MTLFRLQHDAIFRRHEVSGVCVWRSHAVPSYLKSSVYVVLREALQKQQSVSFCYYYSSSYSNSGPDLRVALRFCCGGSAMLGWVLFGLDLAGLGYVCLGWVGLVYVRLGCVWLGRVGFCWVGICLVGLGCIGCVWVYACVRVCECTRVCVYHLQWILFWLDSSTS